MRLQAALDLRRDLVEATGVEYTVMRSGKRSLGVTPFYVRRATQLQAGGATVPGRVKT